MDSPQTPGVIRELSRTRHETEPHHDLAGCHKPIHMRVAVLIAYMMLQPGRQVGQPKPEPGEFMGLPTKRQAKKQLLGDVKAWCAAEPEAASIRAVRG